MVADGWLLGRRRRLVVAALTVLTFRLELVEQLLLVGGQLQLLHRARWQQVKPALSARTSGAAGPPHAAFTAWRTVAGRGCRALILSG